MLQLALFEGGLKHRPERLRAQAVQMSALALRIRDDEPAYANLIIELAEERQALATSIEDAARPPLVEGASQPVAQLREQIQHKQDKK